LYNGPKQTNELQLHIIFLIKPNIPENYERKYQHDAIPQSKMNKLAEKGIWRITKEKYQKLRLVEKIKPLSAPHMSKVHI